MADLNDPNWWTWLTENGIDPVTVEAPKDWWQQAQGSAHPCYAEQDWKDKGGDARVMNMAALIERVSLTALPGGGAKV